MAVEMPPIQYMLVYFYMYLHIQFTHCILIWYMFVILFKIMSVKLHPFIY